MTKRPGHFISVELVAGSQDPHRDGATDITSSVMKFLVIFVTLFQLQYVGSGFAGYETVIVDSAPMYGHVCIRRILARA